MRRALRRWLEAAPTAVFSAYAIGAAFTAYFSMYGFRKPFSAGTYAQQEVYGLELKFALVIAQILGYTLSKFISIKVISELSPARRLVALLSLVGVAELALLGVAVLPMPLKPLAIFFNGLPLGAIWGLVFSFLEGRQTSEVLGAGLSMSYIVASGAVKTVGRWVLMAGVPELWMPFVTGLVFAPVFVLACVGLSCLPRPSPADRAARTERAPMGPAARLAFVRAYGPGLFVLVGLYVLLTAFRDFRDNFAYELWAALGYAEQPAMLTYSELPVAASVMFAVALIFLVRDNRRAFFVMHGIMIAGAALTLAAVLLLNAGLIGGAAFMMLVGSGLYLGYVPYNCVLFDRLIAMTHHVGTAVFMIFVADACGYAGSVALLLYKSFGHPEIDFLSFFKFAAYATGGLCLAGYALSMSYFARAVKAVAPVPRPAGGSAA